MKQKNESYDKKIVGFSTFNMYTCLGTSGGDIFANGNMQCCIRILIVGYDSDYNIVKLTDEQLGSIELIDYLTNEKLSGKWTYSDVENDYNNLFPNSFLTQSSQPSDSVCQYDSDERQIKRYWITAKKSNSIQVGARIILYKNTVNELTVKASTSVSALFAILAKIL